MWELSEAALQVCTEYCYASYIKSILIEQSGNVLTSGTISFYFKNCILWCACINNTFVRNMKFELSF